MRPVKKSSRVLTQPQSQPRLQDPQEDSPTLSGDEKDPYAEKIHFLFSLLERVRLYSFLTLLIHHTLQASSEREELLTIIEEQKDTIEKVDSISSASHTSFLIIYFP
jgi:hypothetical protein